MTTLATNAKHQLKQAQKTILELDSAMLDAFKDELGERKWDDAKGTYTRALHTEEKRLVADMERVLTRCRGTMEKVVSTYLEHLEDTAVKPLTYNTPDEDAKLEIVMETKEKYKAVRTLYSDAMIDIDADLASGGNPSMAAQQKVDDAKREYEEMSERLCEDALRYERIYREELAQRVSGHFMAEQHLLKGVSSAMNGFSPYTRGLTLNWEELRSTRKANLAAAKRLGYMEDEGGSMEILHSSLPATDSINSENKRGGIRADKTAASNPFESMTSDLSYSASQAATALGNAGKNASKSLSGMVASYGAKSAAKSAAKGAGL